jgi:3-deoxy-D-manno-octulosonic acid kinase
MGTLPDEATPFPRPPRAEFTLGALTCVCLAGLEGELLELYRRHRWVYDALDSSERSSRLRGRRAVVAGELPGGAGVVVKRLSHGGLLAGLTDDRFLTAGRFRTQVLLADHLSSYGVPTPEVAFAGWRRVRGLVRGEIGTRRVAGGQDAADYFFGEPGTLPVGWLGIATAIGKQVANMHRVGVWHGDLNLMNLYLGNRGEVMVLDLDKGVLTPGPVGRGAREGNLARLERSIRKQGRRSAPELVDGVVVAVREAYRSAVA